jgi:prefoldin subunit 5
MLNLNKMQRTIDGLLSVFTKLIKPLEENIAKLNDGIQQNNEEITRLEEQNSTYEGKIKEYDALTANVKKFIGGTE